MLDAAEAVVVRQGIANLTLDAVAAEAGLSKGGLLHHFPTKDKLIEQMVVRCAANWRACTESAFDAAPEGRGRMARALLSHLDDADGWTEQCQRSSSAVFAALAQNPRLIEPMRAVYGELRQRLANDGLSTGVGETVVAVMDGLWMCRVLGLAAVDEALMRRVKTALEPLVSSSEPKSPKKLARSKGKTKAKVGKRRRGGV